MKKKNRINKILSFLMAMLLTISGLIVPVPAKAAGETFKVEGSKVRVYDGVIIEQTRPGGLPRPSAWRVGDPIQSAAYRKVTMDGIWTGHYFICIEIGTEFRSIADGANPSVYEEQGPYTGKNATKIKAWISYIMDRNGGKETQAALTQAGVWHYLGQVKWNSTYVNDNIAEFEKAYAANPTDKKFTSVEVTWSKDIENKGQHMISYRWAPSEEPPTEERVRIKKTAQNSLGKDSAPSLYSLAGAEFGLYKTAADAEANTNKIGTMTTDAAGNSNVISNLAKATYFVRELKAPKGFIVDKTIRKADLSDAAVETVITAPNAPKYDPLTIMLKKVNNDGEVLPGAEFTVKYYNSMLTDTSNATPTKTWTFKTGTDGTFGFRELSEKDGKVLGGRIGGDELYKADGVPVGLMGTYTYQETKAPEGYQLDKTIFTAQVKDNGVNIEQPTVYNVPTITNDEIEPQKGIIKLIKVDEDNKEIALSGVEFSIKNEAGTEVQKAVTGAEGAFTSKELSLGKYTLVETKAAPGYKLDTTPIVVEIHADGTVNPITKKYTLEKSEIATIEDNTITVINDKYVPGLKTKFADIEGNQEVYPNPVVTVRDNVEYTGLIVGHEYELKARVAIKGTDPQEFVKDANGEDLVVTKKFTPKTIDGNVVVEAKIDTTDLRGKEIVAFERLLKDGVEVAIHEDINDKDQTIKVEDPKIGTKLMENVTDNKEVNPTKVTLKDIVDFTGLIVGKEYTIDGQIVRKNDESVIAESTLTFKPTTKDGTVELLFDVDATELKGEDIVAFEALSHEGTIIAVHHDINDEEQTVKVTNPEIGTKFADVDGNKEVNPDGVYTFVDTVAHKDLVVGEEYTAKLVVMDKSTNEPLLDKDGNAYVGETTFVAETKDGEVEVTVEIDTKDLRGKEIVAFEKLFYKDIEIAAHEDINDEGQTVKVTNPEIGTTAKWENGQKKVVERGNYKLVDTVSHENLVPGKEYKVVGWVMLKDENRAITEKVTTVFTPKESNGTTEVVFNIDTSKYAGKDLVVFEELYSDKGVLIAEHKDINDEGQTVHVDKKPIKDIPDTGDKGIMAAVALLVVSGAVLFVVSKKKKDKEIK